MPHIHLGVYLADGNEASQAVQWALEVNNALMPIRRLDSLESRPVIEGKTAHLMFAAAVQF